MKQNQSKPKLTKTQTKNLEVDFSDSTKPNRNFADKKKTCWTKKTELENLQIENQTQTQIWKTPPLKNWNRFSNLTIKRNLQIKDGFAFALWPACQRIGSPAAGTGEPRRLKITFSGKWPPLTYAEGGQVEPMLGGSLTASLSTFYGGIGVGRGGSVAVGWFSLPLPASSVGFVVGVQTNARVLVIVGVSVSVAV